MSKGSINRRSDGTITKEERLSPQTEFKDGEHWRDEKPFWSEDWLYREYVEKKRSCAEIAEDFDCGPQNIRYHLKKHNIERRDMSEVREIKEWGATGGDNGMYGKSGEKNPNWKGGVTPERQRFYASREWKEACLEVWQRDEATCQRCGERKEESEAEFHVHHIISFVSVEHRSDVSNLVLLCEICHNWVHSSKNEDREFVEDHD